MTNQQHDGEKPQSGSKVALVILGFMVGVIILVYALKILFGN